jgi:hypothetical protein
MFCVHLAAFLDVLEDIVDRRLSEDFANECNSRGHVLLYYVLWHLVLPSSIHRLQSIACFFEVCGAFVDIFVRNGV